MPEDSVVEEEIPSGREAVPPRRYWQSIPDEEEAAPPLTDEEVLVTIRNAFEETIVMPVLMLEEVTEITRSISGEAAEEGSDAAIPHVQLDSEAQSLVWCSAAAFDQAREVRQLIPRIMEWLTETPTTEAPP